MKVNNITKVLLSSLLVVSAGSTSAAAFQLSEVSSSGLGRAYAGEATIADNASVVATNPALMTQFKQTEISAGAVLVKADVSLKGKAELYLPRSTTPFPGLPPSEKIADQDNIVPKGIIPNLYLVSPINDKFALGGGINVNFGMQSKFASDYSAGLYGGSTKLTALNLNLSGAYRVTDKFSVGLGLNAIHAKASLERNAGISSNLLNAAAANQTNASTVVARLQDSAWGFAWNAGLVYEFNENNRIGLAYHSHSDIKFTDDKALKFPKTGKASLTLNLPAYWEISGYHKMTDKFAMHYSVKRTEWRRFKELHAVYADDNSVALHKPEHFKDSTRIALGATYDATDALTLRAGIAFDESPIEAPYQSASIPDTDRTWYSLGATYKFNKNLSVDLGYTFLKGKNTSFTEKEGDQPTLKVDYQGKSSAHIFGLNLNYRF